MKSTVAFKDFMQTSGFATPGALATAGGFGSNYAFLTKLAQGKLPPNHPYIADIAKRLGVETQKLEPLCQGKPMSVQQISRLTTRRERRGNGKAVILHPTKSTAAIKKRLGRPPGSGKGVVLGKRNSLKRQNVDLRTAVRGMLTTTNVAIMKGDRYVPNIPTEALFHVLTDYAIRRGIKTAVVLDPKFADLFD